MENTSLRHTLRSLLTSQKLAVLASYGDSQPYCSLMAFAVSEDLKYLLVATKRGTRKYRNIQEHPRVSLLIDNRRNQAEDFQQAVAVTVLATAAEIEPEAREQALSVYLFKHPYMRSFCQDPDCALLKLTVARYLVVSSFRNFLATEDKYLELQEFIP
jgi:nitroimidazol reductase NimA-like FMN-containing flavoprotein (pyridoxamine 5'-phosphate oxidase superfamily)